MFLKNYNSEIGKDQEIVPTELESDNSEDDIIQKLKTLPVQNFVVQSEKCWDH